MPPTPTVLNVDPDPARGPATTGLLQRAGFRVREALSGGEALRGAPEGADVILLAVELPDADGFAVCRRLKGDPASAGVPVLLRSASFADGASRARAWECGAHGLLRDAVEPGELVARVRAALRPRPPSRPPGAPAGAGRLAHDLNNAVQAISGYAELLLRGLHPGDPHRLLAEDMKAACERLAGLVRQLRGTGRHPPTPRGDRARALGWEGAYGPGPFEVVRATDLSDRGIPAAAVLKLREINPVWLAQLGDDTRGR